MMKPKDRLKVFSVGFLVGCVIVTFVFMDRQFMKRPEELPTTEKAIQEQAVPGILKAYDERQVPMDSKFIKFERVYPSDEGYYHRVLILSGAFEGQLLRIEETIKKGGVGEPDRVTKVRVMSADKLRVKLKPERATHLFSDRIRSAGYRILRKAEAEGFYVISINASRPESVKQAIDYMRAQSDWVSDAIPDYLDESFLTLKTKSRGSTVQP